MANRNLTQAKNAKNDEFYTQWRDIEREVNAYLEYNPDVFCDKTILCPCDDPYESNFFKYFALHFNTLGLKKLIATCYAGSPIANTQISLFDHEPVANKTTKSPHKIEMVELADYNQDTAVDLADVEYLMAHKKNVLTRLQGDGDFRSNEVKKLRDDADIIITNPPFSLFREFLAWIIEADKEFLIIGNMNAITYKEVFPLIKENKLWLGPSISSGDRKFNVPVSYPLKAAGCGHDPDGRPFIMVKGVRWFTNLDHGRRHQPIDFMTMEENLLYSRHREVKGKKEYDTYDNYDAIEVPFTDAIPSDYDGVMGVPISFLDKYCPEQFEILGLDDHRLVYPEWRGRGPDINGKGVYRRVIIKHKNKSYNPADVAKKLHALYGDVCVKNRKGIFEYILGGETDKKLLSIRIFEESTKRAVYAKQTERAKDENISNCPLCAIAHDANKGKIWEQKDMDADHVTAWSKGGATDIANCQMLCKTHNRAKGNR